MAKYNYVPELEMFRRVDNRGPSLKVNIVEARRIKSLMDLGIKAPTIMKKIDFTNNISMTNLRTIMNNIEDGNIDMDGDYPAPVGTMKEMDIEARISELEKDIAEFKRRMNGNATQCDCECGNDKKGLWDKVKGWMKR